MLTLEIKKGPDGKPWVYFTTDTKMEIPVAIRFLEEHRTIMDKQGRKQMTIYDMRKRYERPEQPEPGAGSGASASIAGPVLSDKGKE